MALTMTSARAIVQRADRNLLNENRGSIEIQIPCLLYMYVLCET